MKVALAVIAILVAFSRVYLSQHFLIDIVFGSLIGVVFSIISILVIDNIFMKKNNISFEENMLNNDKKIDNKLLFFLLIIYFFFFVSFNGGVHLFDWDEINFAEIAREMIVTKDYLNVKVNYLPFHEKPPLFMWLQVLSMKLFGINEFAARFPNVICGLMSIMVLFLIGRRLVNNKFGYLWIITYCCSFLPFFYFKSGIIDPWYNLFIFLSLYFIIKYFESSKSLEIVFSAIFCGLALLTKGPVVILILLLTTIIYCYISKEWKKLLSIKNLFIYIVVVFLVGGIWFFYRF